jgi:hypothetical protein
VFTLKKKAVPPAGSVPGAAIVAQGEGMFPAVTSMVVCESFPDGSPRATSSVTLFWHDGSLKACLNDKDADLTAWVSADTLEGLLEALEKGLQVDGLDWRKGGRRTTKKK